MTIMRDWLQLTECIVFSIAIRCNIPRSYGEGHKQCRQPKNLESSFTIRTSDDLRYDGVGFPPISHQNKVRRVAPR